MYTVQRDGEDRDTAIDGIYTGKDGSVDTGVPVSVLNYLSALPSLPGQQGWRQPPASPTLIHLANKTYTMVTRSGTIHPLVTKCGLYTPCWPGVGHKHLGDQVWTINILVTRCGLYNQIRCLHLNIPDTIYNQPSHLVTQEHSTSIRYNQLIYSIYTLC